MYKIDKNNAFYNRNDVAFFSVINGNTIDIYPNDCKDENLIYESLLNFPLALIFYQKGFLILHASVVNYKGKVILFCGPSHSGKSTLSNFLSNDGGSLISDDISVLRKSDCSFSVLPSYRLQKLSDEFIKEIETSNLTYIKSLHNRKRSVYLNSNFDETENNIDICFFISEGDCHKIESLSNKSLIEKLLKFSYLSLSPTDYSNVLEMAKSIEFYNLNILRGFNNLISFKEYLDTWLINRNNQSI